jgi:hypothetical protein
MLMLPRMAALDTSERDALFDVLGLHLTGCPWPRSGGTEAPGGSWLILITQWSRPAGKCYLRRGRIALVCWPPCQSLLVQRCREYSSIRSASRRGMVGTHCWEAGVLDRAEYVLSLGQCNTILYMPY